MSSGFTGEVSSSTGKFCKFFLKKGGCKLGDNCKFLHSEEKNNHAILNKPKSSRPKTKNKKANFGISETKPEQNEGLNSTLDSFKKEEVVKKTLKEEEGQNVINKPCYKFTKSGTCPFGDSCKYQHVLKENRKKTFKKKFSKHVDKTQDTSERPLPCKYFLRGNCKLGNNCQFWHPTEEEACFLKQTKSKTVTIPARKAIERPKYSIDDLTEEKQKELREIEIEQMKKKYPQSKQLDYKLETYSLEFVPSDPDWTFEVKEVTLMIGFPSKYPLRSLMLQVNREQSERLPEPVCNEIEKALNSWLETKEKQVEISGKVELVLRPLLKWLDKEMEDLFMNGLKQYQRDLIAKQAGLEFISHSDIFKKESQWVDPDDLQYEDEDEDSNLEFEKSCDEEQNSEGNPEDSSSSEETDEEEHRPKRPYAAGGLNNPLDEARKGTEIRFKDLQLREQCGTLEVITLKVQVACSRCRNLADLKVPRKKVASISCTKCSTEMSVHYRPTIAHSFSSIIGYLDLEECTPFDLILIDTEFKVNCLNCHKDGLMNGMQSGQMKNAWCKHCHKKLQFALDSVRFTQLTADGIPLGASIYKVFLINLKLRLFVNALILSYRLIKIENVYRRILLLRRAILCLIMELVSTTRKVIDGSDSLAVGKLIRVTLVTMREKTI